MQTEKKMKVLMINGSPNEHGCTDTALKIVSGALAEDGVESETVWLGNRAVQDCIGCGACENLCPSRPFSAIYVEGHQNHRTV